MNIIFIPDNTGKTKNITMWQLISASMLLVLFSSLITMWLILPHGNIKEEGVKALLPKHLHFSPQKHLDAFAIQLGELQARVMRLDAQSQRLEKLALEKEEIIKNKPAIMNNTGGQGGPLILKRPSSESSLQEAIFLMSQELDSRDDYFALLEAKVLQHSLLKDTLPNSSPVNAAFNSSSYGWRTDPFTKGKAFHEGLDFTATTGTPIYAAASGIVTTAEQTHDYGKIVKIDHGSGLETRYAHASKLLVHVGDRITKGQMIAEVGSTGRSTGAHLHYEIRLNGNPLDPRKYLGKNAG